MWKSCLNVDYPIISISLHVNSIRIPDPNKKIRAGSGFSQHYWEKPVIDKMKHSFQYKSSQHLERKWQKKLSILQILCTAVHVMISFSSSFLLLCFLFPVIGIPKARRDAKKYRKRIIRKEKGRDQKERFKWTAAYRNSRIWGTMFCTHLWDIKRRYFYGAGMLPGLQTNQTITL